MTFKTNTSDGRTANNKNTKTQEKIEPCCVYIIDDDFDDRVLARKEIAQSEHVRNVEVFRDGKDLTDYLEEQGFMDRSVILTTPILLIVDIEMPMKDGLEVIYELKSDPLLRDLPLVVLTGTENQAKFDKAKEMGANAVLRKPLTRGMIDKFYKDAWKWPPEALWGDYSK